jgi:sporulation protein YlmC with PRC-barrel domain
LGEEALFCLELAGMDAPASGFDADRVFEVKHLMVKEILDSTARSVGAIEHTADDNGVVSGVVVAQHSAGVVRRPGKRGTTEKAVKEASVERLEDLVEMVVMAYGREDALATAGLTDVLGLP